MSLFNGRTEIEVEIGWMLSVSRSMKEIIDKSSITGVPRKCVSAFAIKCIYAVYPNVLFCSFILF